APRHPHSFPTRRSSDLIPPRLNDLQRRRCEPLHQLSSGPPCDEGRLCLAASSSHGCAQLGAWLLFPGHLESYSKGDSQPWLALRSEEHTSELQSRGHLV